MKLLKIAKKILTVFIFLVSIAGVVMHQEMSEKQKFFSLKDYTYQTADIAFNEKTEKKDFEQLFSLAKKNDILLVKYAFEVTERQSVHRFYFSLDQTKEILDYLGVRYQVTGNKEQSYASTDKKNQTKFVIQDFLGNDNIELSSLQALLNKGENAAGGYRIYFKNVQSLHQFMEEAGKSFPAEIKIANEFETTNFHSQAFLFVGLGIAFVSLLIYLILEIFYVYNQSKKIAIMNFLGLGIGKMFVRMVKKEMSFSLILSGVLLGVSFLFLKNIDVFILAKIFLMELGLVFLFFLLTFLSIFVINQMYSMVELLKNKKIHLSLVRAGFVSKVVLSILFVFMVVTTFSATGDFFENYQKIKDTKDIANLAFFGQVHVGNDQHKEEGTHPEWNRLYAKLQETSLDFHYIDYAPYDVREKEDIDYINGMIEEKEYIPLLTVDINYLEKNHLQIFDQAGKSISLKDDGKEHFLFPKGMEKFEEGFEKYYKTELAKAAGHEKVQTDFSYLTYKPTKLPIYALNDEGKTEIESKLIIKHPIIRVIYADYPINYIDEPLGINLIGTGQSTSLKIKIEKSKEATYQQLLPILKEAKIDKIFAWGVFTTIGETLNSAFAESQLYFLVESFVLVLIVIIYTVISFEVHCLLLEREKQRYSVKVFMGHKYLDIYRRGILTNVFLVLGLAVVFCLVHLFVMPVLGWPLVFVLLGMFAYEMLLLFIATKQIVLDNVASLMKQS